MTFPIPPQIWAERPITSIWTDFTNAYDGKTLIGSYGTGTAPSGWTNNGSASLSTSIVALDGTISGQALRCAGSETTGNSSTLLWDLVSPSLEAEILMGVHVDAPGGTVATRQIGASLRYADASTFVVFALFDSTDRDQFEIYIPPTGPVYTPLLWDLNTWYWMRLRSEGNDYKAKLWKRGDPEPSSWTATSTDPALTLPGRVGIAATSRTPALIHVDFFSVSTDGTPAYAPGL